MAVRSANIVKHEVQNALGNLSGVAHKFKGHGTSGIPYSLKTTCVNDKNSRISLQDGLYVYLLITFEHLLYFLKDFIIGITQKRKEKRKEQTDAEEG